MEKTSQKFKNLLRIPAFVLTYIGVVLISSHFFMAFSSLNLIETRISNNGSLLLTFLSQSYLIFIDLSLLVSGLYLIITAHSSKNTINRKQILLLFLFVTLAFGFTYLAINKLKADLHQIKKQFDLGEDWRSIDDWRGWEFLQRENYEQEVYFRVQAILGKGTQDILNALTDSVNGVHNFRNWILNHLFVVDLLELIYRNFGLLAYFIVLKALISMYCLTNKKQKFFFIIFYLACWGIGTVFAVGLFLFHSMNLENSHKLCLPRPNSALVNLTINSESIEQLKEIENSLIDYYRVYANVCESLSGFHGRILRIDKELEVYVLGFLVSGCLLTGLYFLYIVYSKGRQKEEQLQNKEYISLTVI